MAMDRRRLYPDYEVGFDACDPLGSVLEWSRETRAARVLQRRCKSEGLEKSPYDGDDACFDLHTTLFRTPKSQFTINNGHLDRLERECRLPVDETGDFLMGNDDHHTKKSNSPANSPLKSPTKTKGKSKSLSPPLVALNYQPKDRVEKVKRRLPKVEELLQKVEHSTVEIASAKLPLKSIVNNNLPIKLLPPQSILKKPKIKPAEAKAPQSRRRQRAASESDHIYCNYRLSTNVSPNLFDGRLTYLSTQTKRVKDNSYAYRSDSPHFRTNRAKGVNEFDEKPPDMRVLRTSVINNVVPEHHAVNFPRFEASTPQNPCLVPPSEPVPQASPPASDIGAKRRAKKKVKVRPKSGKKRAGPQEASIHDANTDYDSSSRTPSPSYRKIPSTDEQNKTDPINKISKERLEKLELERQEKLDKITAAINVTSVPLRPKREEIENKAKLFNGTQSQQPSGTKKGEEKVESKRDAFIAALHTTNPFRIIPRKESPLCIPEQLLTVVRQSLFPRVPPYIKFVGHEDPMVKIPLSVQKHLKWKMTTITPIVVKKTLTNSGFRLVKSECDTSECPEEETVDWIGIWGKHMKSIMFRSIKDGQKMNHFPGTFQVGRKDRLWRNLQKLCNKYGLDEFGIMPKTYVLPNDMRLLKHDWDKYAADEERWIIKPPASARGTGIKVVSRWAQIPKKRSVVVQKYINKPYLINGNKFDLRLYVLVTSVHPLRIYLHKDGLARFASVKYNDELSSLNDRYMHLTNYSINRLSKNYTPNEDFNACEGHKWTLQSLFQYLKKEKKIDTDALWISLKDLVIKTIISGEASISSLTKANITSRYNCYELFGIDVLLDQDLKPWLLEVNISPSLHSASPLDIHVKGPLVTTVLNVAQFQIPAKAKVGDTSAGKPDKLAGIPYDNRLYTIYLSKEERDKHIIYTNMEERETYLRDILSTLTPDDVRHLIQAEDELTQAGDMERIFPTQYTYKYLYFLSGARYYNRLFDAWETRYHKNRASGIDLLRSLCEIGYHLEVPPVPLKNDIDAPSPPVSEPQSVISIEMVASTTPSQQTTSITSKLPAPTPVPVEA